MAQEKVTREELLAMHIGQTRIFTLIDKTKLQSVASTLTQLKNEDKGEWTHRKDYDASAVSVTRIK
jgi:hypothetical protein